MSTHQTRPDQKRPEKEEKLAATADMNIIPGCNNKILTPLHDVVVLYIDAPAGDVKKKTETVRIFFRTARSGDPAGLSRFDGTISGGYAEQTLDQVPQLFGDKVMKRVLLILLLGVCAAGGWFWLNRTPPESGDTLVVYGNVDIRQVALSFRVNGRIDAQFVDEGQAVTKGQLLARLDPQPASDALRRAEAELRVQEAELAKMHAGYRPEEVAQALATLAGSRISLESAKRTLDRLIALRRQEAVSQQMLDDARSQHAVALAEFQANEEQARLMEQGYRKEDIASQMATTEAARAAVASARLSLADTELFAPQAGVVLTRVREVGSVVQAGQTVYTLTLTDPTWVRAFVTQPHLGFIRPGQEVWLSIDSAPGKRFKGTVGFISPQAEFTPKTVETREVRNDLVFRFRVLAEDPENMLRQGMPVTVTVPLAETVGKLNFEEPRSPDDEG